MTRVNFVKKANKAYPKAGIEKGEPYYWWCHYKQPKQFSKTRPKPSQVASSEYARSVLVLVEGLEACQAKGDPWTEEDRDDLVAALEELRDQEQDKFDNMPEGFQQGDTGLLLEERAGALDEWIGELERLEFTEDGEYEGETPLEQALASATVADA